MKVERTDNELMVRIPGNMTSSRILSTMDYLRYEELTFDLKETKEEINKLVDEVKKGHWNRIKRRLVFNDKYIFNFLINRY